jgi:nucleotide-binding universal stress UspA family protein
MSNLQRILCAVDFSDFSRRALDHALGVARCYGSTVTVLHVVAPAPVTVAEPHYLATVAAPLPVGADLDRAMRDVEQLIAAERVPGVRIDTAVVEAPQVHREILAHVDRLNANLLVIGTHGRSGFERLFLGSTAEKLLRTAPCPVMTVPPRIADAMASGPAPFTRIVCATDLSEHATPTVEYAASLACESHAELTLMHVIDTSPLYVEFAPPAAIDLPAWTEEARQRLHDLAATKVPARTTAHEVVCEGTPYREIVRIAAERDADLIVLGVRGRRAIDRWLFGSTAHHVVREAHCAVMTVRSAGRLLRNAA